MKKNPPRQLSAHRRPSPQPRQQETKPWVWILGLLLLLALLPLSRWLLGADALAYWRYFSGALLAGLLALPLAARLLPHHAECHFLLALPLGLELWSWSQWSLSYLGLLPFGPSSQILLFFLILAALLAWPRLRQASRRSLGAARFWRSLPWQLLLFLLPALAMSFVRGLIPAAHGLEKFMDYGFMQSLMRSDYLPAADPWLAGASINYYYYGQYLYSFLAKLSATPISLAYNLGFAGTFASLFALSSCWGYLLSSFYCTRSGSRLGPRILARLAGLGTGLFCCFAGNAHDFFIGPKAPGRWILEKLASRPGQFGELIAYKFSEATRYIGYNPPTDDKTIHEFPYYSFLVGDLHAHLCNTVVVLTLVLLFLLAFRQAGWLRLGRSLRPGHRPAGLGQLLGLGCGQPLFPLIGLGLALSIMGNYWDFVIYWGAAALFLLFLLRWGLGGRWQLASSPLLFVQLLPLALAYLKLEAPLWLCLALLASLAFSALIYKLLPRLFTALGFFLNLLFLQAQLLSLPFALHFQPMAKQLALVKQRSPLWQLGVLYGPQALLLLIAASSLLLLGRQFRKLSIRRQESWQAYAHKARELGLWSSAEPRAALGLSTGRQEQPAPNREAAEPLAIARSAGRAAAGPAASGPAKPGPLWPGQRSLLPERQRRQLERRRRQGTTPRLAAIKQVQGQPRSDAPWLGRQTLAPYLLLHIAFIACGLLLVPELVYVVDIYQGAFTRANTMFKFSYQASLLLGLCLPGLLFTTLRLAAQLKRQQAERASLRREQAGLAEGPLLDRTAGQRLTETAAGPRARAALCRWQALNCLQDRAPHLPSAALQYALALIMGLLLLPQLCYPLIATGEWLPAFSRQNYKGLDAEVWMRDKAPILYGAEKLRGDGSLSDDLAAIHWINAHIQGQPPLLEAAGKSYTEANRISAYTGLPTLLGWETHEWLWRSKELEHSAFIQLVAPLQEEVRRFYEGSDPLALRDFLDKHQLRYVYVGDIERRLYPQLNEALLRQLGQAIWEQGSGLLLDMGPPRP